MAKYFIIGLDIDGQETGSKLFQKPTEIDQVVEELYNDKNCHYVRLFSQTNEGTRHLMVEINRYEYSVRNRLLRRK